MDNATEVIAVDEVYRGRFKRFLLLTLRTPSGSIIVRKVSEDGHAACVLPFDPERRVALVVSMPRPPVLHFGLPDMLEAIGGGLDGDEPAACARKEAMEEAGVRLGGLERVGQVWTMPSNSTERLEYFLGAYSASDRVGSGGGLAQEHENITVHELPLHSLWAMIEDGSLRDGKLFLLLQALKLRRPELFR